MKTNWLAIIAINTSAVILTVIGLEVYARIIDPGGGIYLPNDELGWAPAPNLHFIVDGKDKAGVTHPGIFETNSEGFREWGNLTSGKPKIFFVGDSFTADTDVSNDHTYFRRLKSVLEAEVFAIGAGGYGTLQEYLLVKRFSKTIDPDLFIIQFCLNDFSNNSLELEDSTITREQKNYRPYWVNGEIKFRNTQVFKLLSRYSYFFRYLDRRVKMWQFKYYGGYSSPVDTVEQEQQFDQAEQITLILLKKIADEIPKKAKLATFSCSTSDHLYPNLTARWIRVAKAAGFLVWPSISEAVEKKEQAGNVVGSADGVHWSSLGHQIAAEALAKEIRPLLKKGDNL